MLKIIIVEENPVMTISLKKILTLLPEINTIEEAVNGQKLFQFVEEFNLDVVFLDLDSTEINGFEVAKTITNINLEIFVILTSICDSYSYEGF